jgi:hypothetical protein
MGWVAGVEWEASDGHVLDPISVLVLPRSMTVTPSSRNTLDIGDPRPQHPMCRVLRTSANPANTVRRSLQ